MSLFNRMMASIGIGSAKVDTLLEKTVYYPGEDIQGIVRIQGGSVEQRIEGISLSIMSYYFKEVNDSKVKELVELSRFRVTPPVVIRANETQEIAFQFRLPSQTPLTIGKTPTWIKTTADIRAAADPTDNDHIEVRMSPEMGMVWQAIESLGFRLKEAETMYAPKLGGPQSPFVQEFEFVPYSGAYRGRLDELELIFLHNRGSELNMLLQIDRKATGLFSRFAEALDMDETFVRLTLSDNDFARGPQHVASVLQATISRYAH
ncbi:sporulation protein [Paenibacillus sp. NPDC058071]|uniref:sporulation protein n=1 Tax=Paenibacillus sp. NPDC058071 TaxID=3346326 RepID=UPI0036D8DE73